MQLLYNKSVFSVIFDDESQKLERKRHSRLVLSGHGKRSKMLWDSIRYNSHAGSSGTGIFTGIRSSITSRKRKGKPEMGILRKQSSQVQTGRQK